MITFFTTAKDFVGKTGIAQTNAIKSWIVAVKHAEVILFGACEGGREISKQLGCLYKPDVNISNQGIPFVNSMFDQAAKLARHKICCFINADIIVFSQFAKHILTIHEMLKKKYLVVGQRYDIDFNQKIHFDKNWEKCLDLLITQHACIHPPLGSDFFAFPTSQYCYQDIPDLIVGRGGWDNWMIYDARIRKYNVIDLSRTIKVIHQNHGYPIWKNAFAEDNRNQKLGHNYSYLPNGDICKYHLDSCNYCFEHSKLYRNFANGNWRLFLRYELYLSIRRNEPLFHLLRNIWRKMKLKSTG